LIFERLIKVGFLPAFSENSLKDNVFAEKWLGRFVPLKENTEVAAQLGPENRSYGPS
jgi:hypothetical protein